MRTDPIKSAAETDVADPSAEYPWAAIFIEIALRAIRRVHFEYGMWGLVPQGEWNRAKAKRINGAHGIDHAYETAVCDAITQEFVGSSAVAGMWSNDALEGGTQIENRYFLLQREVAYESNRDLSADIVLRKFKWKDGKVVAILPPSFIEAKRARCPIPDLENGATDCVRRQVAHVREDVVKLRTEIQHRIDHGPEPILGHILVWGVSGKIDGSRTNTDKPFKFFKDVGGVELHALRWLPLQWDQPARCRLSEGELQIPQVQAALWVALAEVIQPEASAAVTDASPASVAPPVA